MNKGQTRALGPLVRIRTGKLDANANDPNGQYPFFTCSQTPLRISSYSYEGECVLVAGNGDLNVKYYEGKFDAYQRTYIIESLDSKILFPKYLFRFLSVYVEELRRGSIGGVIKFIKMGHLTEAQIPVPPLAEQERIVKLLDAADELRKLRSQADTRTAALQPALFHELFGDPENNPKNWPVVTFEKVISSTKLGLVRGAKETGESLPFPYLRMDAILGDGNLALTPMKRVNATATEVAEFSLSKGDFLFNTRNSLELVGKTALFDGNGTYLFNNNIMRIRFNGSIEPHYMIALFQTDFVKRQLESRKSGTTSVVAIYFKNLSSLKVVVPPLPLQKEFAKRVTEIRELEVTQTASRQRLESLFQSMLHRAFNGEL